MANIIGEIVVAVLALVGSLIGTAMSNSKTTALISYRLESLEKKVEKHNQVVERMALVEKDVKTAFQRIDELRAELRDDGK